jgi:hypothetical protein
MDNPDLHIHIAKYLSKEDLLVYVESFGVDTPTFWGHLLNQVYPEYTVTHLEGYPFKDIWNALRFIDEYEDTEYEFEMYHHRMYSLSHVEFIKMYPAPLNEQISLIEALLDDYYTGIEYLIITDKFNLNDSDIESILIYKILKVSRKLLEYIIDNYAHEIDHFYLQYSFSVCVGNNAVDIAKFIHSKMIDFDETDFYAGFMDNIINEKMISVETFEYIHELLGPACFNDMFIIFNHLLHSNEKLLDYITAKLPDDPPLKLDMALEYYSRNNIYEYKYKLLMNKYQK